MIQVMISLTVRPDQREEVLQTLRSLAGPTQAKRGSVGCHVVQDVEDRNRLTIIEEWMNPTDLDDHCRSDDYKKVLALLDMSTRPPVVRFNEIARTQGIERVRTIRLDPTWKEVRSELTDAMRQAEEKNSA